MIARSLGAPVIAVDRNPEALAPAARGRPSPCPDVEQGSLQPQRLVERTVGLEQAAALLPGFDRARVAGMTMVDPSR